MSRPLVCRCLLGALAVVTVAFIFGNSLQTGQASGELSTAVTVWVNEKLEPVGWRLSELVMRKLGHFSEFALLGFWLLLLLRCCTRHVGRYLGWPLWGVLLTGVTDEFIQRFVADRGSDVADVLIDFSGAVYGMLAAMALLAMVRFWHRKRTQNKCGGEPCAQ